MKRSRSKWLAPALSEGGRLAAILMGRPDLAQMGSRAGFFMGQAIKDVTGYGAYTIRSNSLMGQGVPSLGNDSYIENGSTISHREYVGDIVTSPTPNTFKVTSFRINPGNNQLWEWLAQIAVNWEEWIPQGIIFYFKSTSGDALSSTNTALGVVIMSTQYDPYAAPFTNKAEMENFEFTTSGLPSADLMHGVECDPQQQAISVYKVSSPSLTYNGLNDYRWTTPGTFSIATAGFQGASVQIGELWVTYQITLLKPRMFSGLSRANDFFFFSNDDVATGKPLGTTSGAWALSKSTTVPIYAEDMNPHKFFYKVNTNWYQVGTDIWSGFVVAAKPQPATSYDQIEIYFPKYSYNVSYFVWYRLLNATPVYPEASTLYGPVIRAFYFNTSATAYQDCMVFVDVPAAQIGDDTRPQIFLKSLSGPAVSSASCFLFMLQYPTSGDVPQVLP